MRATWTSIFGLFGLLGVVSGCSADDSDDKTDDDIDITDYGDFDDGADGSGSGEDDGGSGSEGGLDDGGSGSGGSSGTGGSTGSDGYDDGEDGGEDDGGEVDGGGSGSTAPPVPAYGPSDADCEGELVYEAQMLDAADGTCVACTSGVDHWAAAIIYNPCDVDLEVDLYDGYVIGSLELENHTTGEGMGMGSGSTGTVVRETIGAGEWLSDEVWMDRLSDGEYTLNVGFFDMDGHEAGLRFTVE